MGPETSALALCMTKSSGHRYSAVSLESLRTSKLP